MADPAIPAVRAAGLLGRTLRRAVPLHGGDLSEVVRIELGDGSTAVLKRGGTARAEAAMLAAIRAAGAPAPEVLAVADDLLVLEDLGPDDGPARAWAGLGRALAALHAAAGDRYGWDRDHAFGPVPIPNEWSGDWPAFWRERRLLPSLGHIPADLARGVERLAARLEDLLPARPKPSLLHGDLWTGNVMARGHEVTGLIDPACYYGHAEVDTAMLTLFGSPRPEFWDSYGAPSPGADRAADLRRAVYQLWPALAHVRLFGAGYHGLAARLLAAVS